MMGQIRIGLLLLVGIAAATGVRMVQGGCTPDFLQRPRPPDSPLKLDLTIQAQQAFRNLTTWHASQPQLEVELAKEILANRSELSGVAILTAGRPPLLAINRSGNRTIFRDRSGETGPYWRAIEGTMAGWAAPFRECHVFPGTWMQTFVLKDAQKELALAIFLPMELDACDLGMEEIFGGKHKCDDTTKCIPELTTEAKRGAYRCVCKSGFFYPSANETWSGFSGKEIEEGRLDVFSCMKCPDLCEGCEAGGLCWARRDILLRTAILIVQATCMGVTVVMALVVFKQRKCKTIATGMWTVLETILLGMFLLYSTVVLRLFEPSVLQCLAEPWAREIGFVICYGAIVLKLYRHLIEFRTRKAHRWVVKDTDLLKYLLVILLSVFAYMSAYTAISLNFLQENYSLLVSSKTPEDAHFRTCKPLWWDYVTEAGELVILVFGVQLGYASRNAKTQFQERQFLCTAIAVELVVSSAFYAARPVYLPGLHPDMVLLAYFLRSQLTTTMVFLLVFVPKLWYQHKHARSLAQEYSCRLPVDAFKSISTDSNTHGPLTSNNSDVEIGEVTLADMNPDDIRAELKRLYMQLEILKNKTLRTDNPHISKRRGGRKVAHRRFSLQKKGSREKALHGKHAKAHRSEREETTEAEPSRTPEDSICSGEGASAVYNDLPSGTYSDHKQ